MVICIDYSDKGLWIAWDEAKGVDHYPRLEVCANPLRLQTVLQAKFPDAIIKGSDALSIIADPMMNDYIGSGLHKHDLGKK